MEVKPFKSPYPFRKLTKELIDKILSDIANGSPHRCAAEANGVTETIFNVWRCQGRVDLDHDQDTLPAYLVVALARTKQKEIHWCRSVIKESEKSHKGAEWTLEHAYWQDFSSNAPLRELADEIEEFKRKLTNGEFKDEKEKVDTKCEN